MVACANLDLSRLGDRETIKSREQTFVYLAYLDDSDTKDKSAKWQVMAAVMIPDYLFTASEVMLSFVIQNLIPEEKLDDFEEFHASDLFGGYRVFEGIDQQKRLSAIELLLDVIGGADMHIAYGAVDLDFLRNQDYHSANPQDIAFCSCVKGIQKWLLNLSMENSKKGLDCPCQGRSNTRPAGRSKSRPVDSCVVVELRGEGPLERSVRGPFSPEARSGVGSSVLRMEFVYGGSA